MLEIIILLAFVANSNLVLTDTTPSEDTSKVFVEGVAPIDENSEKIRIKCGPNQVWDVCPLCPQRTCKNMDVELNCLSSEKIRPDGGIICPRPRCRCANGYYSTDNGKCVKKEECPSPCGDNEVYAPCANAGCGKWNCTQVAQPDLCIDIFSPDGCKGGCVCKTGYLRTAAGKCVAIDECPINEVCPNPNEYLDKCSTNCPDKQCGIGDVPTLVACTRPSNPADCTPSCRCKEGYYRNTNYQCVTLKECPPKCGPNEVPSDCGNNPCIPDCAQPDKNLLCKFDPKICKPGCVCAGGYVRNTKGVCVLKNKCNLPQCRRNEVSSDCGNNGCLPTCAEPERLTYCDYDPASCLPGCVCAKGYLRNNYGLCVTISKCPPIRHFPVEAVGITSEV